MNILLVFLGGGLGSVFRYLLWKWLGPFSVNYPWSTFSANAVSCLLLGIFLGIQLKGGLDDNSRLFLMIGFCGGFSTFSTFSAETLKLLQYGQYTAAASYILGSLILCWVCILAGIRMV